MLYITKKITQYVIIKTLKKQKHIGLVIDLKPKSHNDMVEAPCGGYSTVMRDRGHSCMYLLHIKPQIMLYKLNFSP